MHALGVWVINTPTKDETMSQDARTTRRAMLAGTGTFALAIPAIASTPAIAGPDAELLALGARIDRILPRLLEINSLGAQSNRALEKHLKSFSGDDDAWNAEFEKWWREHPEEPGKEAEPLFNQADPIAEAILSVQPRTLAGLAVLARAAAASNPALWYEDDRDRLETRTLKRLIEATCDLAGVPYPSS
jgi:hypothetical protein